VKTDSIEFAFFAPLMAEKHQDQPCDMKERHPAKE
jgi:hypothetical protein